MDKKKIVLEKCYKCQKQKNTLRLIMFYGKKTYICKDCKVLKTYNHGSIESYWLPSNEIH